MGLERRAWFEPLTILLLSHRGLCGEERWWEGAGVSPGGWHCLGEAWPSTTHPKARPCGGKDVR